MTERPREAEKSTLPTTTTLLHIRALRKSFGSTVVLDGVDLDVDAGGVVCLIGRSGSGKSTLLRCIQLLESFEAEELTLAGRPHGYREADGQRWWLTGRELARERSRVGMVFQQFNLFPHMTVFQNVVEATVHVQHIPRDEAASRAVQLLERVGLDAKMDAYPNSLSGGQQQRVAIARTLAMKPDLVLFDEPTSALDPELVHGMLELIGEIAAEGVTMIVATHEMRFVASSPSKVVFLDGGVVVEEGPPQQVLRAPIHEETRRFLESIL